MTPASPTLIIGALLLDFLLGDPRWLPHPVVGIGLFIAEAEGILRQTGMNAKIAGILLLASTVGMVAGAAWLLLAGAALIHPLARDGVALFLAYSCLAARSLHGESKVVADALTRGDLPLARQLLARIVGRDTDQLEEPEIWRGVVETVAENSSDGVIAPLLCLILGGPVLGLAYKAVNTLDSMVGYKNDRYLQFGRASARFDDLVNWVPARLTGILMTLTAPLFGLSLSNAWLIMRRDGRNHSSPNSGIPEAAAAGALGVQLGGTNCYFGKPVAKPTIGDSLRPLSRDAWRGAVRLMYGAEVALVVFFLLINRSVQ